MALLVVVLRQVAPPPTGPSQLETDAGCSGWKAPLRAAASTRAAVRECLREAGDG